MNKLINFFDLIGIKCLLIFRSLLMKKRGLDVTRPIVLQKKFKNDFKNYQDMDDFVENFFPYTKIDSKAFEDKVELNSFLTELESKSEIFNNRPYQVGGLDVEIKLICTLLAQYSEAQVLEVGVASGYSSACLFKVLDSLGGSIVSIDLPRIAEDPKTFLEKLHSRGARQGYIKNTGTIIDLNPGGVIPPEKYAGWMIPFQLRNDVDSSIIYGDVFNIITEFEENKFDFIVLDAMKDYQARIDLLEHSKKIAKENCIIVFDGYWVNSAFDDFCKNNSLEAHHIGKVGLVQIKGK